jgi:thiosulfate dehydrogenase
MVKQVSAFFTKRHFSILGILSIVLINLILFSSSCSGNSSNEEVVTKDTLTEYQPPDTSELKDDTYGRTVKYGAKLMINTAYYIGPNGIAGHYLGNEMNCTNCHLDAGAKTFGNSLYNTHRAYPQYRAREDKVLTSADRVNNCIERPHNGTPMPLDSYEMLAFVSYIQWLGKNYDPELHYGHGLKELDHKGKASNPEAGRKVYEKHCQSCHLADGQGVYDTNKHTYINPPLWGKESYQMGSSMHRVLKAASFIYHNMPRTTTIKWDKPTLTIQEALDVAAFVNSNELHPRPKGGGVSYPNFKTKPIDYYEGPFNDSFSVKQHTFGPWDEMVVGGTK